MLVELVEIKYSYEMKYSLSTIFINPIHIVSIAEDNKMKRALTEGKMNLDLTESTMFTKVVLKESRSFSELTIVGSPQVVHEKIYNSKKRMLLMD